MIKFYNTLTRRKEEFKPLKDNEVRIYTCGPTVYDYAHIGNLRSYIFADVLRRTLELVDFKVKQVINITDVGHLTSNEDEGEDKIEKGAKKENKAPQELAQFYTKSFLSDIKKLNIEKPEIMPQASENVKEMIAMIKKIIDAGYAYETKDGIYFDSTKYKKYGLLSKQKIDLERRSRLGKTNGKRHPTDFALWLKTIGKHKSHLMKWDSPWGEGFPGWHIECSAMSQKYLGDEFDIHTGGVDHIPVHHENEIAQSVAANAKIPARFWLHGAFLLVDKEKMAKSKGNFLTLSDVEEKGFDPLVFRFLCLRNHYRSQMIFSWDEMVEAKKALERLKLSVKRIKTFSNKGKKAEGADIVIGQIYTSVMRAFFDDLNIPVALDSIFVLIRYINNPKTVFGPKEIESIINLFRKVDQVLALNLFKEKTKEDVLSRINKLVKLRKKAKKEGNYQKADEIRWQIEKEGYKIEDLGDNRYRIIKK